jgi:saccharopine dehydrogenase-like NADP-dependent oxidoreductase
MIVLLVGVGGVGEAIAVIAKSKSWIEKIILADYNLSRAIEVQQKLGEPQRFPVEFIDANQQEQIYNLVQKYKADLIMNACDPLYNLPIFNAAYEYGCGYMDMAMTLSEPHPLDPSQNCIVVIHLT